MVYRLDTTAINRRDCFRYRCRIIKDKEATFDTPAQSHSPPLIKQLKEGGRLIVPLGSTVYFQTLTLATKRRGELDVMQICPVAFVPMTGEVQKK